jgi:hypothetical protein
VSLYFLNPSNAYLDLSFNHSSLTSSWILGRILITSAPLVSIWISGTIVSNTSTESYDFNSHGLDVNAYGPLVKAPTGQTSTRFPYNSLVIILSIYVPISVFLPLPLVPNSVTPAYSSENLIHLVQWMHLFMDVATNGPKFLSSTALLYSLCLLSWKPYYSEISCKSHSPP